MAPININLVYLITVTFSFKLNLTFPYRKNTKLLSHKQPSRSSRILTIIYLILLITNNNNCGKNDQYFQHKEYNVPFSDDNIFDIFSSEPIIESQYMQWCFKITINNSNHNQIGRNKST